jgi:hypothetical protein
MPVGGSTMVRADLALGAQLLCRLPFFLRDRVGSERARAVIRERLARREADFLAVARDAIYGHGASPYRRLLALAGCEYGDLERLVTLDGVEDALRVLLRQGVYLTVDEFKGRRPAVRGGATVEVRPDQLRNPSGTIRLPRHTGGSRGLRTAAPFDLAHVRDRAIGVRVYLDALGAGGWRHGTWEAPGGGTLVHLLEYTAAGAPMVRWFTPVRPTAPGVHARYRFVGRVVRVAGLLAGRPQPRPTYAPLDDPRLVARWMAETLRNGGVPHLFTYSSAAVRLCLAAAEAGIDLRGARFTVVGEPFTPARQAVIRAAGAVAVPRYGSAESSAVGSGCLAPVAPDDMHLLDDLNAVIQPGADGAPLGVPARGLFLSSLRSATPVILLNVSLGDQAELIDRRCGCPMERCGWRTHVQSVRSFEKLTAGGMTFLDTDVIRVLEEVLPARIGGRPLDYQLVEDESDDGRPRVRLLVSPAVGVVDPGAVSAAFLAAMTEASPTEALMAMQWRQAGLPIVERREPYVTPGGKILHFHTLPTVGAREVGE